MKCVQKVEASFETYCTLFISYRERDGLCSILAAYFRSGCIEYYHCWFKGFGFDVTYIPRLCVAPTLFISHR
jgi:hypothetical protein